MKESTKEKHLYTAKILWQLLDASSTKSIDYLEFINDNSIKKSTLQDSIKKNFESLYNGWTFQCNLSKNLIVLKKVNIIQQENTNNHAVTTSNDDIIFMKIYIFFTANPHSLYSCGDTTKDIEEIYSHFCDFFHNGYNISKDSFKKKIIDLLERDYIIINPNSKYILSTKAPTIMEISIEQAIEIYNNIEIMSDFSPFKNEMIEINNQLKSFIGFEETYNEENALILGRNFKFSNKIDKFISKLYDLKIDIFATHIEYTNSKKEMDIKIGNVVYSVEKDKIYLLAEYFDAQKLVIPLDYNIDWSKTKAIENKKNDVYLNEFYFNVVEEMFSISIDNKSSVEIDFQDIFRIKEKIVTLKNNRPKASIIYNRNNKYQSTPNNVITYQDEIRGLNDLKPFLRSLGSSCHVIKPQSLANDMLTSANKTLSAYEEAFKDNKNIMEELEL